MSLLLYVTQCRYVNDDYDIPLTECRSYPDQLQSGANEQGPVCFVNDTESGQVIEETCSIHYCRREC